MLLHNIHFILLLASTLERIILNVIFSFYVLIFNIKFERIQLKFFYIEVYTR